MTNEKPPKIDELKPCPFCDKSEELLSIDVMDRSKWGWGYDGSIKLTLEEAERDQITKHIFIDRGYLRMAERSECGCMDHGQKVKINYCPECGKKLKDQAK